MILNQTNQNTTNGIIQHTINPISKTGHLTIELSFNDIGIHNDNFPELLEQNTVIQINEKIYDYDTLVNIFQ